MFFFCIIHAKWLNTGVVTKHTTSSSYIWFWSFIIIQWRIYILSLRLDRLSNMNLTNEQLLCNDYNVMGKQILTLPLLSPVTWSPASGSVPGLLPGVGLTISLITGDNLIMGCLCGRPLDPGHRNWVRSHQHQPLHINKQNVKGAQ